VVQKALAVLPAVTSITQAKDVRDWVEAARVLLHARAASLEAQNRAAMARMLAEQKIGGFLTRMAIRRAMEPGNKESPKAKQSDTVSATNRVWRGQKSGLSDLGINKWQSHQWQQLARLTPERIANRCDLVTRDGKELTLAELRRTEMGSADWKPHKRKPRGATAPLVQSPASGAAAPFKTKADVMAAVDAAYAALLVRTPPEFFMTLAGRLMGAAQDAEKKAVES
jgi:hypothetical protein